MTPRTSGRLPPKDRPYQLRKLLKRCQKENANLIVDVQVHIGGTGLRTNPAHRQISSFTANDPLKEMDEAGVDAAVIHPPGWDPNPNQLAIEAARQHPNPLSPAVTKSFSGRAGRR